MSGGDDPLSRGALSHSAVKRWPQYDKQYKHLLM